MAKQKLECYIIEDILPSYADGLTCAQTNADVAEHLAGCASCRSKYEAMKEPGNFNDHDQDVELDYLRKTRKCMRNRIVLGVVVALVIALTYTAFVSFNGSFLFKAKFTKLAEAYVSEHYAERNFQVEKAGYDFKTHSYFCKVSDPESADTYFNVYPENGNGDLRDDYDARVTSFGNTWLRLNHELSQTADELLKDMPWRYRTLFCTFSEDMKMHQDKMYLDMPLDLNNLPGLTELTIYIETDNEEPTWEEAEDKLIQIKEYCDSKGIHPDYFCFKLEYPYEESKSGKLKSKSNTTVSLEKIPAVIFKDPASLHKCIDAQRDEIESGIGIMGY